jgi:RNA polymerase sigma factor (sigma-70 family)
MIDDEAIDDWFCREVLPLERSLTHFIRRNWRVADDVIDLRHDVYELALAGARNGLPTSTRSYVYAIARNHLINSAKRSRIVSFDLVADLEEVTHDIDLFAEERHLTARDTLRQVQVGMEQLSPRVREIVHLRKFEGLDTRETADRLGIGVDAVKQQLRMGMQALADFMLGGSGKIIRPQFKRRRNRRTDQ